MAGFHQQGKYWLFSKFINLGEKKGTSKDAQSVVFSLDLHNGCSFPSDLPKINSISFPKVVIPVQGKEEHRSDSLWQNITWFEGWVFSQFYFLPGGEQAALTKFLHDGILQEFYNWKSSDTGVVNRYKSA